MSVVVHYCDKCGIRIEPEDIDEKRAIITDMGAYCPKCAKKIKATEKKPDKQVIVPPQRKATTRVAPVKKKGTASFARRPRRGERIDEYEHESRELTPVPAPKKSSLPIVLGVCGVIIVVIIIAIAAGGSGKPPVERSIEEEFPEAAQEYRHEERPEKPERIEPRNDEPLRISAAVRRYRDALEYGNGNPEDYAGVLEKLESILKEETVDLTLSNRIEVSISDWNGRWDDAARKARGKIVEAAEKLLAENNYEGAAKLWDEFSEEYKIFKEDSKAEASRLRKEKEAIDALKEIESDIKSAEKEFSIDEIEQAEKLLEKLCEFGMKYQDSKLVVDRLQPIVTKLRDQIDRLEEEKWARELEELSKQQEEEKRQKQQQRWAALKKFWQGFYQQYDQNAAVLPIGTFTLYDGSSPRGWTLLTGRNENVNWTFTGGLISGRNGSAKNTILGPHYKEAYFWQNYTFTLKIRVVSGNCQVGARCNVNDQRNLSGATFQVPAGKWVEMKVVANGDQAVATADGQQAGAINTNYPTGYPAIFLMPNSQVEIKDVTMELKSNRK